VGGIDSKKLRVSQYAREYVGSKFLVAGKFTPIPTKGKPKRSADHEVIRTAIEHHWTMADFEGFELGYAGMFPENPWRSMAKYSARQEVCDPEVQRLARSWVMEDEKPYISGYSTTTHEWALNELDARKSPGSPWNRVSTSTGQWLKDYPDHLERLWEKLGKRGSDYVYLWSNSEKEELRAVEKLADRKIRTFVASSKEMVYASHRLFGKSYEAWCENHAELNHGIGFNKYEGGWDKLTRKISKHPNAFGADVDGRDGHCWLDGVAHYSWMDWLVLNSPDRTTANYNRFVSILKNRCFSYVVDPDGYVWVIPGGNKSGDPKTIQINTRQTKEEFYYAWVRLTGIRDRKVMRENVEFDITGDDVIFSVSNAFVEVFNFTTVSKLIQSEYGTVWTTDYPSPRHACNVPYLSNYGVIRGGIWVATPVSNKIMNSLMKATKKSSPAMSLVRAWACYREVYWNDTWRALVRTHIHALMKRYGRSQKDDPDWQLALTSASTDDEVEILWGISSLVGVRA